MRNRVLISLTIDRGVLKDLDALRGQIPRSRILEELIKERLRGGSV